MASIRFNPIRETYGFDLREFEKYPVLSSSGAEFQFWRIQWTRAFKIAGVGSGVMTGAYMHERDKLMALHMLQKSVDIDLLKTHVSTCNEPFEIWNSLAHRFDSDTDFQILQLYNELAQTRQKPDQTLAQHFDAFHIAWCRLFRQCESSRTKVGQHFVSTILSDKSKCYMFLSTLPSTLSETVEEMLSEELTWHGRLQRRILELSKIYQVHDVDTKDDLIEMGSENTQVMETWNNDYGYESKTLPAEDELKECTFCRKRNRNFIGHDDKECWTLKKNIRRSKKAKSRRRAARGAEEARFNDARNYNAPKSENGW